MYTDQDYVVSEGTVVLRGTVIKRAEPTSFRRLYGSWSRDRRSVYWSIFRRNKINVDSFEPLNEIWGRDDRFAYPASGKPILGVDPKTFRTFDAGFISDGAPSLLHPSKEGFAGDANRVFFFNATYPSAWEVKGANAEAFVSLGARYGRDHTSVFYEQRIVKHAKPRSFRLIGLCGYAADDERVYFGGKSIDGADARSFVILWCSTLMAARDARAYYYSGRPSSHEDYITLLEADAKNRQQHLAEVESGEFDNYFSKCMIEFGA